MAKLLARAPMWAQRRAAYEAESRGEDPTPYIQTAPGGTPGRIQGLSALQRIAATQAYRARTSLPQRRASVQSQAKPEAEAVAPVVQDVATQQFENRRKRLMQGGISAPEADLEARNEFQASPSFVGPRNVKVRPKRASSLAHLSAAMAARPRVQY